VNLRAVHELCLAALCACALIGALYGTAPLPLLLWALLALGACTAQRLLWPQPPTWLRWALLGAGLPLAVAAVASLLARQPPSLAAFELLAATLLRRLGQRSRRRHDAQAVCLAAVALLAGSFVQSGTLVVPLLLLGGLSGCWALWCEQLAYGSATPSIWQRRELVGWGFFGVGMALAVGVLLIATATFVLLPRLAAPGQNLLRGRGASMAQQVDLTDPPRAAGDGAEVLLRLRGVGSDAYREGLYLRGVVLDAYLAEGRFVPATGLPQLAPAWLQLAAEGPALTYEVEQQPLGEPLLFSLGRVTHASLLEGGSSGAGYNLVGRSAAGELVTMLPPEGELHYKIDGYLATGLAQTGSPLLPAAPLPADFAAHFLKLPPGLNDAVPRLARQLTAQCAGPREKVAALSHYLRSQFTYALRGSAAAKAAHQPPLENFLFTTRRGHCEFFATALAVLLRAVDVPSRVIGGFALGRWDPSTSEALFTAADAHAWVEWYDAAAAGWRPADATPPAEPQILEGWAAWRTHWRQSCNRVLRFHFADQMSLWQSVSEVGRLPSWQLPSWRALWHRFDKQPWQKGLAGGAGLVILIGLFWGGRRLLRRIKAPGQIAPIDQLRLALQQRLRQMLGTELAAGQTFREAVAAATQRVPEKAHHPDTAVLAEALALYESGRFSRHLPQTWVQEAAAAAAALSNPAP
jgi:hypothetical protein